MGARRAVRHLMGHLDPAFASLADDVRADAIVHRIEVHVVGPLARAEFLRAVDRLRARGGGIAARAVIRRWPADELLDMEVYGSATDVADLLDAIS